MVVEVIDRKPIELKELKGNLRPGIPNSFSFSPTLTEAELTRLKEIEEAEKQQA